MVRAINTFAIPVLSYSFGIVTWSRTDLEALQRKVRTELTSHRKHHSGANAERITLPRDEGGRGVTDIKNLHNKQIRLLRSYFHRRQESRLHVVICSSDEHYSPLNLSQITPQESEALTSVAEKTERWKRMALHGRHPNDLSDTKVDKKASNAWLTSGYLFPETEGFLTAIQDQVINTKNYQKHIVKNIAVKDDRCRRCQEKPETIQHITGACSQLAQNDYLHRHNQVANIVHQQLSVRCELIDEVLPYYKYKPEPVLGSVNYKIYYDRSVITDRTICHNRPDILLHDKKESIVYLIDIAVPNTHNMQTTINEKVRKYTELAEEVSRMWKPNNVYVVPIVLSTTGVIPMDLHESIRKLSLPKNIFISLQKAVILATTRIVRKFLSAP